MGAEFQMKKDRPADVLFILAPQSRLKASPKAQNKIKVWKVISADSVNNCAPLTQFLSLKIESGALKLTLTARYRHDFNRVHHQKRPKERY